MNGPAGSGITFTYNYLIAETISRSFKSATAAWTGKAATLLTNGSTLHGLFKLSVAILDNTTCNVTPNSIHGNFLKQIVKRRLQQQLSVGGKVILFGGDFRQILPVVKRVQPAEIVESCIKFSLQWQWVQKFTLTENMRVHDGEREFSQWLLKLGNGTMPVKEEDPFKGCIEIPNQCIIRENESGVEKIFGDADQNDYSKRVKIYLNDDQIDTDDLNERNSFPVEFLNSLTPSGMPPHCLKLKIVCLIILLKFLNLNLKAGLCNGTRMKVSALQNNYIDAEVLTGVSGGKRVFVSRIQLAPSDSNLPFVLKRRQFAVRLAYSMTNNKSQGQTFDRVRVYLKKPCFSHGKLYVACSKTRAFYSLFFKIDKHFIQETIANDSISKTTTYIVDEISPPTLAKTNPESASTITSTITSTPTITYQASTITINKTFYCHTSLARIIENLFNKGFRNISFWANNPCSLNHTKRNKNEMKRKRNQTK
ncbi:uncharacterized protein LOC136083338 [Hydra vulgaris]|uniref:ATP-dependent DNA helicase n=1 Tax=Hydra vulgaris TaxID=6087 RepID=A0ABM4CAX8_HYDVU